MLRVVAVSLWVMNAFAAFVLWIQIVTVDRDFLLPVGASVYLRPERDDSLVPGLIRRIGQLSILLVALGVLNILVYVYEGLGGWRGLSHH